MRQAYRFNISTSLLPLLGKCVLQGWYGCEIPLNKPYRQHWAIRVLIYGRSKWPIKPRDEDLVRKLHHSLKSVNSFWGRTTNKGKETGSCSLIFFDPIYVGRLAAPTMDLNIEHPTQLHPSQFFSVSPLPLTHWLPTSCHCCCVADNAVGIGTVTLTGMPNCICLFSLWRKHCMKLHN